MEKMCTRRLCAGQGRTTVAIGQGIRTQAKRLDFLDISHKHRLFDACRLMCLISGCRFFVLLDFSVCRLLMHM
jgi:hypothetical protein